MLKYSMQLKLWDLVDHHLFNNIDEYKLGLVKYDNFPIRYIIYDVICILAILFHQHILIFIGLWESKECDIETIPIAQKRVL